MDYKNGKIYTIRSYQNDKFYIGSTTQPLCKRLALHKKDFKKWESGKRNYLSSFEIIKLGDAYIELFEEFPCNTKAELNKREGELIRQYKNDVVNIKIEGRTNKEYVIDNKDIVIQKKKEYYQQHKEEIKQYHKDYRLANIEGLKQNLCEYYLANSEKIKQKNQEYRLANIDKIKQYKCEYRLANSEKIKQKIHEYRLANKEKIKQKRHEYYIQQKLLKQNTTEN